LTGAMPGNNLSPSPWPPSPRKGKTKRWSLLQQDTQRQQFEGTLRIGAVGLAAPTAVLPEAGDQLAGRDEATPP